MVDMHESLMPFEKTGLLFRNFFAYGESHYLKQNWSELSFSPTELNAKQWLEVEYDFNRLFVGPSALLAPPYASVYLGDEPFVLRATTLDVRELMQTLGVKVNRDENTPGDHISYELELVVLLLMNVRRNAGFLPFLQRFFSQHLTLWVPVFIEKITNNASTALMRKAALELSHWFDELKTRVCYEQ